MKNNKFMFPYILTLVAALLMVATVFLPYATATAEYSEVLNAYPDATVFSGSDITAKDMLNVSMFDFAGLYANLGEQFSLGSVYAAIYIVIIALIGGFSVFSALFALLKKPVPTIVFAALSLAVFSVQCLDYTDRGVIGSTTYTFGIGFYLFFAAFALVLAGAIWMLVLKIKQKKQNNAPAAIGEE